MEDADRHECQSVVRGGQVVFPGKLAVETTQVIGAPHLLGVPILLFVELLAGFQFFDQIIPKRRVLNAM